MTVFKSFFLVIIALAAYHLSLAQSPDLPASDTMFGKNDAAGKYADVSGINLYFETYGQGDPLLMIHGNGGSISSFVNQIPYFAAKYKVIAVDSRAQGRSVDTGDSLSFEMMADDFSELLDKLQIDSCNVIGWSDGGINGLLLAIRHPGKVKRLAITGANLWPDSTAISGTDYMWSLKYYDTLGKMPPTDDLVHIRKLIKLDLFEPHISLEQLKQIHCPTLVIGGDHDVILPQHTMLIAQSIPGAYLWILPNSSHSTLIDYKDKFNTEVDAFFEGRLRK